jgi:hypothetical protein
MRALEERVSLSEKLAERAQEKGQKHLARRFRDKATYTQRQVLTIRQLLVKDEHADDQPVA